MFESLHAAGSWLGTVAPVGGQIFSARWNAGDRGFDSRAGAAGALGVMPRSCRCPRRWGRGSWGRRARACILRERGQLFCALAGDKPRGEAAAGAAAEHALPHVLLERTGKAGACGLIVLEGRSKL